ncbi:SufS family cysteine desulfurase [Actinomadura rubrisoli]|uniref:SufS family cysteine desulfurase n=1 Tax=Actinomadura rubrisoli TaxID=2530368 RepID=UPI00312C70C5
MIKKDFPLLAASASDGRDLVYLDSAATSHKPWPVLDAMSDFYARNNANVHRAAYDLGRRATEMYEASRDAVAAFIGAPARDEIVFTKNTTEALNIVAGALAWADAPYRLESGDQILVTEMEHHSNLIPWRLLAERTGARLCHLGITDGGRLDLSRLAEQITPRTKVIAVGHASNSLGTINPIGPIAERAAQVGALVVVDAAQSVPHVGIDVGTLGADFVAFSGHKMCGPTGIGVLWGRTELLEALPPFLSGGSTIESISMDDLVFAAPPYKFEAGTPPIAEAVGLGAAIGYLRDIGLDDITDHTRALTEYALQELAEVPGTRLVGPSGAVDRGPVISFVLDDVPVERVRTALDQAGVAVRSGNHCAQLACLRFGVPATVRASFYLYNTPADIDVLSSELRTIAPRTPRTVRQTTGKEPVMPSTTTSNWGATFASADVDHVRSYQDVLVPALFHPWGCLLTGMLDPAEGSDCLDIGTGPGTVARIMAANAGPSGSVVGTDINSAMLALAAEQPPVQGAPIEYVESGAAPLDVPDAAFDIVTAQHVLQFVPDRPAALAEIRRALRPGGRLGVMTWLGLDDNPLFQALHQAVAALLGDEPAARFAEPWTLEPDMVAQTVEDAGFTDVTTHLRRMPITIPGGAPDLCRVFDFSAVRADVAALAPRLRTALHAVVASFSDTAGDASIHAHTAANVILARG